MYKYVKVVVGKISPDLPSTMIDTFEHSVYLFLFLSSGLMWCEVKQLWDVGLMEYVHDMWNILDFLTNALYLATITLRVMAYLQVGVFIDFLMTLQ